ncbi:hypothetical protein ABW19_dt0209595 [Dactylella cylindrospora]|nr:hypothetical protein ABW19_dt0209595 [Dactylella cylindrospora]
MQFSQLSFVALLLATLSVAAIPEQPAGGVAGLAAEPAKRNVLAERAPKKGSSSGGSGGDAGDEEDAATSVHLNIALAAGAGVIAVGAMML